MTGATEVHLGSDDVILLGHATGFCKETWWPVVSELRSLGCEDTIVAWDARGHGASPPLDTPVSWWTFGEDLVELVESLDARRLVGVGHSMSGAALAMCEVIRPASFSALLLIEPVIIPPPFVMMPAFPLAMRARKRRPSFESRQAASERYLRKDMFARWHPEAFSGYLSGGLVEHDGVVHLACAPEIEAEIFSASAESGIFARVSEVAAPVRLVVTDDPGPGLAEAMDALVDLFPAATSSYWTGQNHLVVMERPDIVAAEVMDVLAACADPMG